MNISPVRAAIVELLRSVANVGVVHEHEPLLSSIAELRKVYVHPALEQLRGWYLKRTATRTEGEIFEAAVETITWDIVGYSAVAEAGTSESEWDAVIDAVREAFRADYNLGGVVASCTSADRNEIGIQVRESQLVMFCDVLCHRARLQLSTLRYREPEIT